MSERETRGEEARKRRVPPSLPWKTLVRARIARLEDEIRLSEKAGASGAAAEASLAAAREEVERAHEAVTEGESHKPRLWRRALYAVTGSDQEQAWLAIHAAEAHLTLARPDAALVAELPSLEATLRTRLRAKDPLLKTWQQTLKEARTDPTKLDRYSIRDMKETVYGISDKAHARMRSFRNILLLVTVVLAAAMAVIAIPPVSDWVPLCPTADASDANATQPVDTKDDTDQPDDGDTDDPDSENGDEDDAAASDCTVDQVWKAELLGVLGGLLAILAAVRRIRGFRNPFNLPLSQLVLKIPAGALTGLLGLILMQGGILFLEAQSGLALAAYVIFFGASQELVTRLVDRRAGEIAEEASSPTPASDESTDG